ncbi:uncharacterized protein LOC144613136 [Panthera onca]
MTGFFMSETPHRVTACSLDTRWATVPGRLFLPLSPRNAHLKIPLFEYPCNSSPKTLARVLAAEEIWTPGGEDTRGTKGEAESRRGGSQALPARSQPWGEQGADLESPPLRNRACRGRQTRAPAHVARGIQRATPPPPPPAPSSAQLGRSPGPERPTRPPAGQRRAPPGAASARPLRGPTRTQLGFLSARPPRPAGGGPCAAASAPARSPLLSAPATGKVGAGGGSPAQGARSSPARGCGSSAPRAPAAAAPEVSLGPRAPPGRRPRPKPRGRAAATPSPPGEWLALRGEPESSCRESPGGLCSAGPWNSSARVTESYGLRGWRS